jgi:chromosome segregation ATPase
MKQIAVAAMLFVATNGLCQSPSKDNDTLQSLMGEVHQLRMDIEAMTVASQRVQIALYQLQIEAAAVARAAQRVESVHDRCTNTENTRQNTAAVVQRSETALASGSIQDSETKQLQSQTAESQACQTSEVEASGQLQHEQVKLTEMQERIERLDKTLEKLSGGKQ